MEMRDADTDVGFATLKEVWDAEDAHAIELESKDVDI